MKLTFEEKIKKAFFEGATPDIKGRARITLTDPKTGKREQIVSDNMVTNAIKQIYGVNPMGLMNFHALLPMWKLFGGCMLFQSALTEDANAFWPENSDDNPMTAYCNQTTHATADPYRGNPGAVEVTDDHIKLVFDWNLGQGNGTISAVALSHQDVAGLCPTGSLPLLQLKGNNVDGVNYARIQTWGSGYNRAKALTCPVIIKDDGTGLSLYCDGSTLEEIQVSHPFINARLLEDPAALPTSNYREVATRSVNLSRTFDTGYTFLAFDANNYYVMERDSGTNTRLHVDVIDRTAFSMTSLTLDIAGATLDRYAVNVGSCNNGIVSDGSVYWRSGADTKTFVRINLSNVADVEILSSNMSAAISFDQSPLVLNDGLILGRNFLINGATVYPVATRTGRGITDEVTPVETLARYKGGPLMYQGASTSSSTYYQKYVYGSALALPYLATVNNLPSSVTKQNSKTMRLEYILTET